MKLSHARSLTAQLKRFSLLCSFLAGCASTEPVHHYPDMPLSQARQVLAERSRAFRTISAQADLTLTRPDGQSVRLEAAIAMQPPERARLRAYKFGSAVLDITVSPDGMWLLTPRDDHRGDARAAASGAGSLTRDWLRLFTGIFDDPHVGAAYRASRIVFTQRRGDGAKVICEVDRPTLTARSYSLEDAQGTRRFLLTLCHYSNASGLPWPGEIRAQSATGNILIQFHNVDLNTPLPAAAFTPPARAEKLP